MKEAGDYSGFFYVQCMSRCNMKAVRFFQAAALLAIQLLVTGCSGEQANHQPPQKKAQVYRQKAHAYLLRHKADVRHESARALRYTRLKLQRAKCRLHPKDRRACRQAAPVRRAPKH